jgi:hypothetical protein
MKKIIIAGTISLFACSLMAADSGLKDEVKNAAKKLAAQDYSWKSTVEAAGGGGGGGQFRPGPTEGKILKDGTACITTTRGENTTESFVKGDKGAIKTDEGWQSLAELADAAGGGGQPNRGAMMARTLRNFKSPAVQAEEFLANIPELKKVEGAYVGDMTEAGAKQLLTFGRRPGSQAPEPKDAKGSVKFWIKDGVLAKYEFNVQGKITGRNDQEMEVNRTTTVEIKDVGNTKVNVPEEVKKKLS